MWFVGATPDVVAGVWLGFDRPQRILANASGGGLAAPVWGKALASYYQSHGAPTAWTAPADLLTATIDRHTGKLATGGCPGEDVRTEYFIPGHGADGVLPAAPGRLGRMGGPHAARHRRLDQRRQPAAQAPAQAPAAGDGSLDGHALAASAST